MSISQDFEARRRERLKKQRQQRRRLKMLQLLLSVVLFILVIVIIVTSISKCDGNSSPEIDNSVPVTTSVPYESAQPSVTDTTVATEQTQKYEIPSPSKGKNDILSVIKESGQKQHVYLTFNNGPDNKITPQILDILRRYDIKATFFMIGENIEKSPQLCARVIQEGHLAAPLAYSDDFRSMFSSKSDFIDDMNKTYELINQSTLSEQEQFKIVRFPGGSFDESGYGFNRESYKAELAEEGFYYADWNCTIGDSSSQRSADNLLSYFAQNRPQLNNLVILMRDSSSNQATVDMLERLIKQLSDEGYIFSRLDEIDFINPPEYEDENEESSTSADAEDSSAATAKPSANKTATSKPATEKPATEKPATATKKPSSAQAPAKKETSQPATEKPKNSKATQAPASSNSENTSQNQTSTSAQSSQSSSDTSLSNSETSSDEKVLDTE